MDERMAFIVACRAHEESMSLLCRQFGISRKTGYKWLQRYLTEGAGALGDRSHARHHPPHALSASVVRAILALRARHSRWGPRKLRAWLARRQPGPWPAPSTIGLLLQRRGLTVPRRRHDRAPAPGPSTVPAGANDVWAADFKGWFRTGDGGRCEPLTISDLHSRYLLRCQIVATRHGERLQPLFEATFREYGLPRVIRTDNGAPFAARGLTGLSPLAVWWIRLGIRPERILPGHPEQNGAHERLHRTLKDATATPPRRTVAAQQRAFDEFRQLYNHQRPHEALGQQPPAAWYTPSPRPYPDRLPEVEYPARYLVRRAHPTGEIKWCGGRVRISQALAGQPLGLEEVDEDRWRVWFAHVALGWLDGRPTVRGHAVHQQLLPIISV